MNQYDHYFDFRMANWDDIDAIMGFIKEHWDANHILANDRSFFEYHYGNPDGGINVFLMCDKTGKIVGMLGFVQYSAKGGIRYISGSVEKVMNGLPVPMCGIELMRRFYKCIDPFIEFTCGANPKTIVPIFEKVFKYKVGIMSQYYILNPQIDQFKIITVPQKQINMNGKIKYISSKYQLKQIGSFSNTNFDFDVEYANLPIKDKEFLEKRYFYHPIFQYAVYKIAIDSYDAGLLFTRKIHFNGSSIILIVDFMGELSSIGLIGKELRRILIEERAECISILETGISEDILLQAGFQAVKPDQTDTIIPTYFEPFVNCNIVNHYIAMKKDIVFFKAVGDQDNPRMYRNEGG